VQYTKLQVKTSGIEKIGLYDGFSALKSFGGFATPYLHPLGNLLHGEYIKGIRKEWRRRVEGTKGENGAVELDKEKGGVTTQKDCADPPMALHDTFVTNIIKRKRKKERNRKLKLHLPRQRRPLLAPQCTIKNPYSCGFFLQCVAFLRIWRHHARQYTFLLSCSHTHTVHRIKITTLIANDRELRECHEKCEAESVFRTFWRHSSPLLD